MSYRNPADRNLWKNRLGEKGAGSHIQKSVPSIDTETKFFSIIRGGRLTSRDPQLIYCVLRVSLSVYVISV